MLMFLWNIIFSMTVLKKLKKLIHQGDMFCSSEMLRYNSEAQYKTLTGGLFSISIIIFIVVAFASMISDTLNRTTIASTLQVVKQNDPPLSLLRTDEQNMFMFGITIQSNDLSFNADLGSGPRYFDITLTIIHTQNGAMADMTNIPMEGCTVNHWSMLSDVSERFDKLGGSKWLCPPMNFDLPLQGIYTSSENFLLILSVTPCTNNSIFDRDCAPQADIDNLIATYHNFYLTMNYINPVISPSKPEHISYYLQANDYVIFSDTVGAEAWVYFSDFTINTDDSIWPLQSNIVEKGCIVQNKAINHAFSVTPSTPYASIYLAKSVNLLSYTRIVQKMSAVFSYIGGLVGAMTAVLFLIKTYTDSSLEIMIGISLFNDYTKQKLQKKSESQKAQPTFNFLKFLALSIYQLLKSFGVHKKWPNISKLGVFQRQIMHQLDIKMLLKRLIYMQTWMMYLFDDQQLQGLKYQKPISCERARKIRQLILHEKDQDQDNIVDDITVQIESSSQNLQKERQRRQDQESQSQQSKQKFCAYEFSVIRSQRFAKQATDKQLKILQSKKQIIKVESDIIPVQFLKEVQKIEANYQKQPVKLKDNSNLDERSLKRLKKLCKRAENDERNKRIWENLRQDIQLIIVASEDEDPIVESYS